MTKKTVMYFDSVQYHTGASLYAFSSPLFFPLAGKPKIPMSIEVLI